MEIGFVHINYFIKEWSQLLTEDRKRMLKSSKPNQEKKKKILQGRVKRSTIFWQVQISCDQVIQAMRGTCHGW